MTVFNYNLPASIDTVVSQNNSTGNEVIRFFAWDGIDVLDEHPQHKSAVAVWKLKYMKWQPYPLPEALGSANIYVDELLDNCLRVWFDERGCWIQELRDGSFFTVVGRTSEMGTIEQCIKCLNDNL